MMVDSLEMTDADREMIVFACRKCENQHIVITHGTDTIVQTAETIARQQIPKTIVLTGAMIPYAFGNSSDGFFNLGAALAFAQTLPVGVYVAMNGRYFSWDKVVKNVKTGFFEEL
jgi:L-asparaginase